MNKLDMISKDVVHHYIEQLGNIIPECITEVLGEDGKTKSVVDIEMLKNILGEDASNDKQERYSFIWPNKRKCVNLSNARTTNTLRPLRDLSVNFDNTKNIYIEGDNLEVIKLLQETYLGKIKMIYIDPPYNTGHDFLYNDKFSSDVATYVEEGGFFDSIGNRLVQNLDTDGRYHTNWLNMIYPRLRLARNLLSDDGVIFISIDDNEVANLKKCCDEIFGEYNFIAQCCVKKSTNGMGDKKGFAKNHEFILCYQKTDAAIFNGLSPSKDYMDLFDKEDEHGKYKMDGILMKKGAGSRREDSPTLYFPLYYSPTTGEVSLEAKEGFKERYPYKSDGTDGRWTWGKEKIANENYRLYASENGTIYVKDYLTDDRRMKIKTILEGADYLTDRATNEIKDIFDGKLFDTPKPVKLIYDLCDLVTNEGDIILDFFGGSSTTAQAVLDLNELDGKGRRYILVQVPEELSEKSEAYKKGYKNICEVGEDRIRKVISKYSDKVDYGFRVFRLDTSNMKDVYYNPAEIEQISIFGMADNIKEDRSSEDLLFQVMLDLGVELSSKIEVNNIGGKSVYNVSEGFLMACFDENVTDAVVKEIANKKPYYAVFRDSSMASDSVATNIEQIFASISPDTLRKVL